MSKNIFTQYIYVCMHVCMYVCVCMRACNLMTGYLNII